MKKILLIAVALFLIVRYGFGTIINVPGQHPTITQAINASFNGDTILVEPGTYYENINFKGKRVVLTSRFYINEDLSYITNTIINGSNPIQPDSASCVIFSSGEDSNTVIQGFTLTGGTGTKWNDIHAAGVYREGGGILIELSSPTVRFNIIKSNSATNSYGVVSAGGGGIRIGDGNPKILNNIIAYNTGKYGAGIVLNYTGCLIKNNIIAYNTGSVQYNGGAAIWSYNNLASTPKIIENNTIIHNQAAVGTSGILCWSTSMILRNNIIWGNTGTATQVLSTGGNITATYNDIQGGYSGMGNINVEPQFADSNYILSGSSPCIDSGDSLSVYNDPPNPNNPLLAKYPSRGTVRNDMGAYGGPLSSLITNSLVIGIKQTGNGTPSKFSLMQNYPNPFNPVTKIKYEIPEDSFVKLCVFDVSGKTIMTLFDGYQKMGIYEATLHSNNLTSGAYFYSLSAGEVKLTKTMILLK